MGRVGERSRLISESTDEFQQKRESYGSQEPAWNEPAQGYVEALQASRPWLRRIRKRIWAKTWSFGAVVPRELVPICLGEFERIGLQGALPSVAGIDFSGRIQDAYKLHLWLRTANRILCRPARFRAGSLGEFHRKMLREPWELWLNPFVPLKVEAHVRGSRIKHQGRLEELTFDVIRARWQKGGFDPSAEISPVLKNRALVQRILVHMDENHVTIGIDMTGEHLHRRGYRQRHGGAPLRETLAAAIVMKAAHLMRDGKIGTWVDAMTGSGTLAIEAALYARHMAPGSRRRFLFELWPSFRSSTWRHLRQQAVLSESDTRVSIWALDRSGPVLAAAKENASRMGLDGSIEWRRCDFFRFDPSQHGLRPGIVLLNPPYGKRLKRGARTYGQIAENLAQRYKGWLAVVLVPSATGLGRISLPRRHVQSIRHGGLRVEVGFFDLR